jgi:hypothetical protein
MRLTFASLLAIAAPLFPTTLKAQTAAFRPHTSILFAPLALTPGPSDTLNLPKTYAREGALIGGIPGLLLGAVAGRMVCQAGEDCTSSTISGALTGAVVFGITGALIGGAIEKPVP